MAQEDLSRTKRIVPPLPDWISAEVAKKAVFNKDKKAIAELDKLMRKRYDDYIYDGFDGFMIYYKRSGPHLS